MKKYLVLTLLIVLLEFGMAAAKDWAEIRVGVEGSYPPFNYVTSQGRLAGFDIDIAYALADVMKAQIELVPQDWDGLIPALLARKFDAIISSMSITAERKKKVAFTDKYYQTPTRFICRQGTMDTISQETLKGKTVGVQRGTIHEIYMRSNFAKVSLKSYTSLDEAYLDMVSGRLDLLPADSIALLTGFLETPKGKPFRFVGPELTDPKWVGEGIGIACRKSDPDLVAKFNTALRTIRANGTYKKIQVQYFSFDIYGN